ncbi:MAG: T9SS C-terminal target domain-containing protein [Chitinophagia bacterium]|nr:T9SS C-terminal target domain-containing protein [Chitinophagia bacterium]
MITIKQFICKILFNAIKFLQFSLYGAVYAGIILTDITGKIVATKQANSLSQTLNLSALPKGNYILTITTASRKWVEKVIVND